MAIQSWEERANKATINRAAISASTNGNNTIVAAQAAGLKIKVLYVHMVAAGAVTATFQSGAGGTGLTGAMTMATGVPFTMGPAMPGYHLFETAAATLLNLALGAGVQVSGYIIYYVEA